MRKIQVNFEGVVMSKWAREEFGSFKANEMRIYDMKSWKDSDLTRLRNIIYREFPELLTVVRETSLAVVNITV